MKIVGVISDTHGLMRPEAIEELRSADLIIHAGDIGGPDVILGLRSLAHVVAIRGNNDRDPWAGAIPETAEITVEGAKIYIIHNIHDLDLDPIAAGYRVVVSGHSHQPSVREKDGVLYLNPGSAGPRRFKLPIAVARLSIDGAAVNSEIIDIPAPADAKKSLTSRKPRHIKKSAF